MNGTDLLVEFRATRAEAAFNELVRRYTNLVYSIAKRRVGDMSLAQEVTQIVFIRLAKAPPKLVSEAQLLAWLHRTAVHVSIVSGKMKMGGNGQSEIPFSSASVFFQRFV